MCLTAASTPTTSSDRCSRLYVQGAPYLLSKSQAIKFQAVQVLNKIHNRKKKKTSYKQGKLDVIMNCVKKVVLIYEKRGFKINSNNADNEFKKIEGKFGPHVEICTAREHIP